MDSGDSRNKMTLASKTMEKVVNFSDVENRLDAEFYRDEFDRIDQALDSAETARVKSLKNISDEIRKGIFDIRAHQYVDSGVPFIRISQIDDLTIDDSEVVYITEEENERNSRTCLGPGDLVIAKSGVTMGITGYVPEDIDKCNISQDIVGVKTDYSYPRYLATYLSTKFGQLQMQRAGSQQAQQHLNLERARNLKVYLPSEQFQKEIESTVKEAYRKKNRADNHLEEAEAILKDELGLSLSSEDSNIYSSEYSEIDSQIRLDAEFYRPKYTEIVNELESCPFETKQLSKAKEQFVISNDKIDPSETPEEQFKYLTISSVDEHTGEIKEHENVVGHEAPSRARMRIKKEDVLVPYLSGSSKAVTVVDEEHDNEVATTGFYVLRPENAVPEFLFVLMRSPLMQHQIEQMTSGAVMTSINKTDLKRLTVPLVPLDIQKRVGELAKKSFELRRESKALVESSKDRVENHILDRE
ncbi:restriction endonuclease subunit S [Natrinema sp. LN54]|uniref:restriction endonuclease subunit S n=1 Tax=Natrinema sp. LN54 TaxID=3458705 RepID=UPI004036F5EE